MEVNFKELNGKLYKFDVNEFKQFYVGADNINDSNRFIRSFYSQIDKKICPKNYDDCPLHYVSSKFYDGNKHIVFLGSIKTSIGFVFVIVSFKRKGMIDNIHLLIRDFNYAAYDDETSKRFYSLLKGIVRSAKTNLNTYITYIYSFKLTGKNPFGRNLFLSDYRSEYFIIENGIFKFRVKGYSQKDCKAIAEKIIKIIVNFMTVETNTIFDFELVDTNVDYNIEKFSILKSYYQNDLKIYDLGEFGEDFYIDGIFIDYYPSVKENFVILSREGLRFIDYIINNFQKYDIHNSTFLNACFLYRAALLELDKIERKFVLYFDTHAFFVSKNQDYQNLILSNGLLYCISAIEVITSNEREFERCKCCGQIKYSISQRIYDFMKKHTDSFIAEIFKKSYNLRSRYVHQGSIYSEMHKGDTYPMLDMGTESGFEEAGFGISVDGDTLNYGLDFFKEWASFALRKHYKWLLKETHNN